MAMSKMIEGDEEQLPEQSMTLPQGGMMGDQLAQYIKANPGPQAIIGNNPNLAAQPLPETKESDEDEEEASSGSGKPSPADILGKYNNLKTSPTKNPPPVKDVLSKLLGQSQNDLAGAQQQRDQLQLLASLGQAGSTVGQAMAPLAPKQDTSAFWNLLHKQAEQPVSDLGTKQALAKGALQQQMLTGQASTEMSQTDPTSAVSAVMRELYTKETGKEAPDTMAYADIAKLEPSLARMFTAQENAKNRAAMLQMTAGTKASGQQDKAYTDARQKIESFRGNAGAQQASRDVLSADKALALLDKPGMKTTQDLQLIADEMAKIATGGVPGEHGVKALMPNNLQTKFADLKNFILSSPTDAQANEYLERNKQYLKDMSTVAKKALYDYSSSIAKGYKSRLKAEDYKELNEDIKSKYMAPEVSSHPQDNEAVIWAKKNPADPRSAAILKANGIQ